MGFYLNKKLEIKNKRKLQFINCKMNNLYKFIFVCMISYCSGRHWLQEEAFKNPKNIYNEKLAQCNKPDGPKTGYYRDGTCKTSSVDYGTHVVCAEMTKDFLEYTKGMGNDLSTPRRWGFPGLKPGDRWCLCVNRWLEAFNAGLAPRVIPEAIHINALKTTRQERYKIDVEHLEFFAVDAEGAVDGNVGMMDLEEFGKTPQATQDS